MSTGFILLDCTDGCWIKGTHTESFSHYKYKSAGFTVKIFQAIQQSSIIVIVLQMIAINALNASNKQYTVHTVRILYVHGMLISYVFLPGNATLTTYVQGTNLCTYCTCNLQPCYVHSTYVRPSVHM